MAARVDADGDALARYTAPAAIQPITVAGYVYFDSLRAVNNFVAYVTDGVGTLLEGVWVTGTTSMTAINDAFSGSAAFTPSTGIWYHVAFVRSGTTHSLYVDGALIGTVTGTSVVAPGFIFLGGNTSTSWADCRLAFWRVWDAALTASELAAERKSSVATRTTNLWADWPLDSNPNDVSGNARTLTQEGVITYVASPALTRAQAAMMGCGV